MALRLRRDVQKASYYVWFLGAEEAKGLRGTRVINSVLPYLIDRSRGQEPLKVTLQVSHKGIKILQGSSKHFIPHSAITSSVQTDDIVACVLLLYNPATKCPLHVHAYRCDSESTAEALHQQLQILINRPENQKRFEELETRLGILPPLPTPGGGSSSNKSSTAHMSSNGHSNEHKNLPKQHYLSQQQQKQQHKSQHQQQHPRRHESSPKRFNSSLGSDTGNSTRDSECSEEHSGGSPISRSPPHTATTKPLPLPQPTNELFDSLAAELRAKLNGNGPPLLLPPRDYDTVHRSKGNLTAIELRRCRNALIVGGATPNETAVPTAGKQISSRGSSGIGSDLAPSPERQELNSSSEDEQWSNEADNSVIALKPSQIAMERSPPIIPHHPQLNRKSAVQPPEDSYLRDLPAKPYTPRPSAISNAHREKIVASSQERDSRSKTPSTTSWSREDEIKPIIVRPADYNAKFSRVLQAETKHDYHRRANGGGAAVSREREHTKLRDTDKYNEINRLLNNKLTLERDSPEQNFTKNKLDDAEDFDDSDPPSDHMPLHPPTSSYRKENLTDKQKFMEYTAKKQSKSYAAEEAQRYGGRHRYVDPADLPFEQPTSRNKYAAIHRSTHSPERSDLGPTSTTEREREPERVRERERDHLREREREHGRERDQVRERERELERERERERERDNERQRERVQERKQYSRSNERNPYREPESLPYIESMEKMMKSSAMRYKSFDATQEPTALVPPKEELHTKLSGQRSRLYTKNGDQEGRPTGYAQSSSRSDVTPKDRFKDAKDKFRAMERTGSRYDLNDEKDATDFRPRRRGGSVEPSDNGRLYADWSDEEHIDDSSPPPPPIANRSRSRSRSQLWEDTDMTPIPQREQHVRERARERQPYNEYQEPERRPLAREMSGKQSETHHVVHERSSDITDARDPYRDAYRYEQRSVRDHSRDTPTTRRDERERHREHREPLRRDYSPDARSAPQEHRSNRRPTEKHAEHYPSVITPTPPAHGAPLPNAKGIANLSKGYRHSYAEPVFARGAGRVGLAAVNPY